MLSKTSRMFWVGIVLSLTSVAFAKEPFKFNVDYLVGDWSHQAAFGDGPLECAANLVGRVLRSEIKQNRFASSEVYTITSKDTAFVDSKFENGVSSYKFTANFSVNGSSYSPVRGYIVNQFFDNDTKHKVRDKQTYCSFGYFICPTSMMKPVSSEVPSSAQQRSEIIIYLASDKSDDHPIIKGTIYPRNCI